MEGADALGLTAEVGIAIAGFAGVVAALRAPGGRMAPYALLRIAGLLALSASVVLLSLLPSVLDLGGLSSREIWGLGSGAMVTLMTVVSFTPNRRPMGNSAGRRERTR